MKPLLPSSPNFATGPVKKIINNVNSKYSYLLGRSHRSKDFVEFTNSLMNKLRKLLNIPSNYKVIITPASDTGAFELALWNMLGERPIDCLTWEVFGNIWYEDIVKELKLPDVNVFKADFVNYPNTSNVNFVKNDVIFTHSGSTSGVIFTEEDRIPNNREGLIFSDATSYAFFYDIDWQKIDVLTFSFQKVIAGEAQHGILVLSPNAVNRLKNYHPNRPIPKLFKVKDNNNKLIDEVIENYSYINTPSALCLIDAMENIEYIENNGGTNFIHSRIKENNKIFTNWVKKTDFLDFLVSNESVRSKVIICLKFVDEKLNSLPSNKKLEAVKFFHDFLAENKAAFDINMHRNAPLGIRIWLGYTILPNDVELLTKWLDFAYKETLHKFVK